MGKFGILTKEQLVKGCSFYWDLCQKAMRLLQHENKGFIGIDVEEIHVDPEEDYVFVSWAYAGDNGYCHTSTSYRINKFLSLINKGEKVDPNDRIPVGLKGAK